MEKNRDVYYFELYSGLKDDGSIIFTDSYVDMNQYTLSKFCIPVDEDGEKRDNLIKLFFYHNITFDYSEMIIKCTDIAVSLLNEFNAGGVKR